MARRLTLKQHLEDAELRLQRARRRLDRQREAVAALERADRDTAKARDISASWRRHWLFTLPIGTG
jgi:hypothetical protein